MPRRSARLTLIFSCLGHLYVHLFTAFYFVIVLALEEVWAMPYHELIELWTLGALLVGLAALPAGWIADRWSTSGMMVIYFIGLGGASLLCGMVDKPSALLLGLAVLGLFAAIYHPVGIAWLVRSSTARGKALGINGIFGGVGIAVAGLVAGSLIDLFSWRAAFIVPGVLCMATGLALWFFLWRGQIVEIKQDALREPPRGKAEMVRGFLVLMVTMLCVGLIFQATQTALPKLFDLRLRAIAGEGAFGVGVLVAGVFTVSSLMQLIGGHMADRYPLKPLYLIAFALQVPFLLGVAWLGGLPLLVAAMFAVLLGAVALPAENMLLARYTPERHRSLAYGAKFVLAFGIAPLAIWMVSRIQALTGEFVWLFALLAGLATIALLAALLLPREGGAKPAVLPAE
jgi:MFS family permease